MALTQVDQGLLGTYAQYTGFKNRIINGAMQIDQRNAGASVTLTSGGGNGYPADRWYVENYTDGTATVQQVIDAPVGFSNSIKYTVTATDLSLASDQSAFIQQRIEGFNSSDLAFGTINAQTVVMSFWVKSSLTGIFSGALANSAYNRGYPFTFTVNSSNTWEQKFVTIAGDVTGTWIGATNGVGIRVTFALCAGSARVSAAGTWASYVGVGATGTTNIMATNAATFQVTGVQLEKGSTATSFDYRPYGTELALCQRYYFQQIFSQTQTWAYGHGQTTSTIRVTTQSPVPMRTAPSFSTTATNVNQYAGFNGSAVVAGGSSMSAIFVIDYTSTNITLQATSTGWFGVITAYGYDGQNRYSAEL